MTRVKAFQEMLRQMSKHFTVSDIQSVIYVWENASERGFMLHMANGEYWYLTNVLNIGYFALYKYPPPIPAISDLQLPGMWTEQTFALQTKPDDLNYFLKKNGKAASLFMTLQED